MISIDASRGNHTQSKDIPIETAADSKSESKQQESTTSSFATLSQEHLQSITKAEEKNSTMDRSISLFSRHAHGEKNSFYTQASNVGSSTLNTTSDDLGDMGHSLYRIESGTNFDGYSDNENSRSSSNPRAQQIPIPKEDHRLQGFRAGDTSGTVSGRLNKYISKDGNNKLNRLESNGEIEDVSLEESSKLRNRNLRAQRLESRRRSGSESDDSNQAGIAMKRNSMTGGSSSDDEYRNESKGSKYNSEEEEKPQKAPVVTETVNKPPSKMAPPPPTSAPPRRAKDALAEAENQRTRRSLDEILFKKENRAESKTTDADSSEDENVDIKVSKVSFLAIPPRSKILIRIG